MRLIAALLAIAPGLAMASASGSYTPGFGCPAAGCADVIDVRLQAPRAVGALFVAVLPLQGGQPVLPGAWLTGPEALSIAAAPLAVRSGDIGPFQQRFRIRGGACAVAAQQGVQSGTFGVYAGYGVAPAELVASMERVEQRVAAADPEAQERAKEALERLRALNPLAKAAADDMLANKTFWPIATITCGAR